MQVSSTKCTVMQLFFYIINLFSGNSIIHPWLREKYSVRKEIAKIFDFPYDEIIRLCEYHRMHAVQIEGQWRIDVSVLSPDSCDFKTMPLWFQEGIINKDREKK
jgi:hypothetical protein